MSRLIESIRLHDGVFSNLEYHQGRMDRSVKEIFGVDNQVNLYSHLRGLKYPNKGLIKCRVVYDVAVVEVNWIPYAQRSVRHLKVVMANNIEYPHKFEDRSTLEALFANRGSCDDIIIVRNGLVADSSYSNLIFFDGTEWLTPSKPLLEGTMRQYLLDLGYIREAEITLDNMRVMHRCKLINAMIGFDGPELSVSQIVL